MDGIQFIVDTALAEVPVNVAALVSDTDFKTKDEGIAYNEGNMDLVWNFVTTGGAYTQTEVTPTTSGLHDWAHVGNAMYSIEIPASTGTINNDTEGFGWFTGVCDAVLPWRGPVCSFVPANVADSLVNGTDYLKVDIQSMLGVEYGFVGQIQAVDADTPSPGITRLTIQDPALDSDAADQLNQSIFFLVDRSQQKAIGSAMIGDYDSGSFYVFVDDMDITPTTGMDYLIVFSPKASPLSGSDVDSAALKQIVDDWEEGGRLDLIQDIIAADTTTDIPALITTRTLSAAQLAVQVALLGGAVTGFTAVTGTLSVTAMTTDLTEDTDDHYIGRTVIWTSGPLEGQASDITDYDGASKMLTYTEVTDIPANLNTFIIV